MIEPQFVEFPSVSYARQIDAGMWEVSTKRLSEWVRDVHRTLKAEGYSSDLFIIEVVVREPTGFIVIVRVDPEGWRD